MDAQGYTPLLRAAQNQRNAVVDALISAGADVNAIPFREKTTALGFAVNGNDKDMAEVLIRAGADVNPESDSSYLVNAVEYGLYGVAGVLLAAGIDVERTFNGFTALHRASLVSDEHAVELLIAAGANPNSIDENGSTPLHLVATTGIDREGMARMLIHAGAKLNIQNNRGETAADLAMKYNRPSMVKILDFE